MEFVKRLGRPASTYLNYHLNFDEALSDLRREWGALNSRKEDINSKVQTEVLWGKEVKHEVQSWLDHVQEINDEVQAIQEEIQQVKWYSRGGLGKLVCKKLEVVKKIREQGSFPDGLVVDRPPSRGVIMPTEKVVGEASAKEKIWGYLMGNEVGMIGVCGIGGVGKTTIMKNINNELVRQTKFDTVIWVTVSYPLNVIKLQESIATAIAGDDRQKLPEGEDKDRRAAALMSIMGSVRHMLILDDVWEKFSLNEVGIPVPTIQNGSKIVITSRSIDVCQRMGCVIVKVEPLSFQESLNLFLDKVGCHILQVPNLEGILKLIVKECGGLPLAIVVKAESMKGEDDVKVWNNALNELREQVKSVNDKEIFEKLRFSYDRLWSSEIQNCFLYCSLFPEDYPFSKEELIEGWIDEGLIDGWPSRKATYERGHAILNKLVMNCLLEKTVNWRGDDVFKMHDVVRDMAIKTIGPELGYMVKAGMKLTEVPDERGWGNDLKKVSLMESNISKIPHRLCPRCPTLSTLILSNNHNLLEIPESFFEGMPELKVLDLSGTAIQALPNSISNLEKLSAMRLGWCWRLRYLPSLAKLRALKKLDLRGSRIKVVPQGMETLISLKYLDLRDCENLEEIPMGMLSNLSNLQYLFVYGELKIKGEEVARLSKLEIFEGVFHDIQGFNYFVKSQDFQILTGYKIAVGAGVYYYEFAREKAEVTIKNWDLGEECIVLPDNLQTLVIEKCKNMRSSLNKAALLQKATKLSYCHIRNCEDMECVVDLDSSSYPVLNKLEELYLEGLSKLSVLVRVEGVATPTHVFSNLKRLAISVCSGMKKLLPLELLQALQNLEEITVSGSEQMEEIIASSDSDASSSDKFTFPQLRRLWLQNLPQLKSICSGKGVMVCDSIEEIKIWKCPELKRIPVQLPLLDNGQPSPPPRLKKINIHEESKEWWESVEWDHKNLLQPFLQYLGDEDSAKEKIWGYLMGNEVRKIGVCGIGGVGKTTIMKHIKNELVRETKFDKVIWVTVSRPLDVIKLQENIARAIAGNDRQRLSEGEDKKRRAAVLKSIMGRGRHLLILDDVSEVFSLIEVGIPEPTFQNGSKIVITSRDIDVCKKMGCKIVKVEPLSFHESLNLFLDKVGHHLLEVPNLEAILKLIVKECGGIPLAIVEIAETMKGKCDVNVWTDVLNELRERVKRVNGLDKETFERLRFSYDHLGSSEIQNCFLYCSLFPDDHPFSREELIEGWIDEGLIDGLPSRKAAFERGHIILDRLVKNCFLEKRVDWRGVDAFKMHGVVRDMAIKSIGPGFGYMVKAGMKLIEVPDEHGWKKDLKKVSLMANYISEIPLGLSPKCPTLSTLMLSNNPLKEIPESFFEDMGELKVLDLSRTCIEALPDSISNLVNLSALRLSECKKLNYLPSLAKFRALKKLDLNGAGIEKVPQGMEMLTSLEYLDLFCDNLKELPAGILSNLSHLQFLRVYLKDPTTSNGRFFYMQDFNFFFNQHDFNYFVQSKVFQGLTAYRFFVRGDNEDLITKDFYRIDDQRVLLISDCEIGGESTELPNNLRDLRIYRCENLGGSLNKTVLLEKAVELNCCTILDCEEMEFVLDFVSSFSLFCPVLDKLENLKLCGLPNLCSLVRVEGRPTPPGIFSSLRRLIIKRCLSIRKLFPPELLEALQNLEEIRVRDCQQMEEIVVSDVPVKFTLPKLRQLYLVDLPQLERICSAEGAMVCDAIEELVIIRCPNLKSI